MSADETPDPADECAETSGFLFPHPCGHFATEACKTCCKPICEQHAVPMANEVQCTTCAKQSPDPSRRSSRSRDDRDDPYFYANRYYPNYYWHHHAFTEGDEAAISGAEADVGDVSRFEDDMGAS